mgnify:FL=1
MIDCFNIKENTWMPQKISPEITERCIAEALHSKANEYLAIFQIEPYIDSLFLKCDRNNIKKINWKRFTFHEGYRWEYEDECFFRNQCLKNSRISFTCTAIDQIYKYYSEKYTHWNLQRYYTKPMRLLDHIYHCMRQDSAKEILYKASLDELAENIDDMDELNLLSGKPSDIYDGVPMRALRALNCREGANLLSKDHYREFLKKLNWKFPDIFKSSFNDAQCRYLMRLIDGKLTVEEAGRLFNARRMDLMQIWAPSQYELFLWREKESQQARDEAKKIAEIDPIYAKYFEEIDFDDNFEDFFEIRSLQCYLLYNRKEYDKAIRRSNRKRIQEWQERDYEYVVRFPQTINDFCREAVYMSNCLLTYVEAVIHNETTIIFIREKKDINKPFITIEVYEDQLMQAYHRFNEDCTAEEIEWICDYCSRHAIGYDKFKLQADMLF